MNSNKKFQKIKYLPEKILKIKKINFKKYKMFQNKLKFYKKNTNFDSHDISKIFENCKQISKDKEKPSACLLLTFLFDHSLVASFIENIPTLVVCDNFNDYHRNFKNKSKITLYYPKDKMPELRNMTFHPKIYIIKFKIRLCNIMCNNWVLV